MGKTFSMMGTIFRSAKAGRARSVNRRTISPFSGTGRDRSTEPMISCRLTIIRARLSSALMPLMTPMITSRPA